jgi:hypothetical protein
MWRLNARKLQLLGLGGAESQSACQPSDQPNQSINLINREGQEDNLAVDTIFHVISDENFVKAGSGRWRLDEDLSVYDL